MAEGISRRLARQIVDTLRDVCGTNINFISPSGQIVASTDESRVGSFHEIGRKAALSGEVVEAAGGDDYYGTQAGVNIPILHHGSVAGVIGISGDPEEVRRFAYLAQKITVLLLRERDLDMQKNSRKERLNYMIRSLAGGGPTPQAYFRSFLKEYALDPKQLFSTVLIRFTPGEDGREVFPEQAVYRALENGGFSLFTFSYPGEYILFLREEEKKAKKGVLADLAAACPGRLRIGVGGPQPLERQYRSYREAELAVRSLEDGSGIACYADLDFEILLGEVSGEARALYLERVLGKLEEEEIVLLRVYFEESQSLLRTSGRLNLHKNTLQYRLDRIFRKSGYDPRRFCDAVILYSGIRLRPERRTDD